MNDPNRKIEIDKSSLLSLKAELLRKQEEVGRARVSTSIEDFVPKKAPRPERNEPVSNRKGSKSGGKNSTKTISELENTAQLARSKQMLQAKTKYYDRMVATGGALNTDENSLVMFNKKKQDTKLLHGLSDETEESDSVSTATSDSENNEEDGDKWVEYTDCLGRTRKCLKKDLEQCLTRDRELAISVTPRDGQRREDMKYEVDSTKHHTQTADVGEHEQNDGGAIIGPMLSTIINEPDVGERFREMRDQWAEQEEANLDKDSIHYQDVLFNEARLHGVGYYAFSTNQQERTRQRDELDSIRESTVEAQRERQALRQARDKIIADRVKAARDRQRARLGLPPEEKQNKEPSTEPLYDTAEELRLKKIEEKERKKKEKEERKRDRERAQHVRPWDEGKDLNAEESGWVPAKERFVLSQHEWNDLKRGERIAEFAPPEYNQQRPSGSDRVQGSSNPCYEPPSAARFEPQSSESSENEETIVGPMPSMIQELKDTPLPALTYDNVLMEDPLPEDDHPAKTLYFTTKKKVTKQELKRRNLNVVESFKTVKQQLLPIHNELSDDDGSDGKYQQKACRKGAEIEPPSTYDYYGPSSSTGAAEALRRKRPATENKSNLEASIEAGLKFLRNKSDKVGGPGTKNRWSSNADY